MPELTARLGLPDLTGDTELYPDDIADGFWRLDAVTDLYLKGVFVNDPPGSASDGDVWLVGGTPGAWRDDDTDFTYKLACRRDGAWWPVPPFNGLRAFVEGENRFIVYQDGSWTDWTSLIGAGEDGIASAATCDIGAVGSLFLQITGTTAITAFGTAANRLRFVRFAGALTLTHNAASLILPGAADLTTAAGDTAIFTSDGSGNWRCRHYARADGRMVNMASPGFGGSVTVEDNLLVGQTSPWSGANTQSGSVHVAGIVAADGMASHAGQGGSFTTNRFNLYWSGSSAHLWVDATDLGVVAFTSDARLKRVLPRQADHRAAIRALWVGEYERKAGGEREFGVLAQQAWEVMPCRMGVTRPATEEGTWTASYEPFAFLSLWGVKDLYALVEALAARVAALEAAHAVG